MWIVPAKCYARDRLPTKIPLNRSRQAVLGTELVTLAPLREIPKLKCARTASTKRSCTCLFRESPVNRRLTYTEPLKEKFGVVSYALSNKSRLREAVSSLGERPLTDGR